MHTHVTIRTLAIALIASVVFAPWPAVFAADVTSNSFIARDPMTVDFGGTGTSSSFSSVGNGGQQSQGPATSTNFQLDAGQLYYETFTPNAQNWRWYDDETAETPVVPLANENVAPSGVQTLNVIKLRMTLKEVAGYGASGVKFKLQYSTSSDFSSGAVDVAESGLCGGSDPWCYGNGVDTDGSGVQTALLTDTDTCAGGAGNGCGTHNESGTTTSSFTQQANAATEYEFTIMQNNAAAGVVYFFRPVYQADGTAVPLNTGESYPSISGAGADLTFTIDGLPAATSTEGVTTDIETTPTAVPFGPLSLGATTTAAHRLVVSTNASAGYRIYAFERQAFLQQGGADIPGVTGTNGTPSSWTAGCDPSAEGCWGYHSGADVLSSGNTVRFAPNDTYAQFAQAPHEVAFASGPVSNATTDIIYRVKVTGMQAAGDYDSSLVYVVTPVF